MRKNINIIEINGQRYDAKTGAALSPAGPRQAPAKPAPPATHHAQPAKPKPATHSVARRQSKQHSPHRPATAHTLMRQAVKKPGPSLKRHSKVQGHVDVLSGQPLSQLAVKKSAERLDTERLRHAKQIHRSRLISHFPAFTAESADSRGQSIPVTKGPRPKAAGRMARPAASPVKRSKTTAELLDQAVQQATSHLEPPPEPARHRRSRAKRNAGIGAAIALPVLILGVIAAQNLSNVRLQLASAKAGFSATLPSYKPAGYSLGQLNYSDGVVAAQFNSGSRHYSVTQKRSSWDSATLRDTFVAPIDTHYQTIQAASRTIYLYGNRSATWVDGGLWSVVQTDGSLSNRQLIDLVTSL